MAVDGQLDGTTALATGASSVNELLVRPTEQEG